MEGGTGGEGLHHDDLPEDLIFRILALLPIRSQVKMRCVCKRWNHLLRTRQFQELFKTMPPSSTPAFCIQVDVGQLWVIEKSTEYYKLPPMPALMAMGQNSNPSTIWLAGSSINYSLLKKKNLDEYSYPSFFVCNPAASTWIMLPRPPYKIEWLTYSFIYAMGFSTCNSSDSERHCTVVFGESTNSEDDVDYNKIIMEVYDCESNTWTGPICVSHGFEDDSIWPVGSGVYSQGKYYWLNLANRGEVLEFSLAHPHWTKLPFPGVAASHAAVKNYSSDEDYDDIYNHHIDCVWPWKLTGTDGRIVVMNKRSLCMWMLNKERGEDGLIQNRWVELHLDLSYPTYDVAVNNAGQILVVGRNICIYSEEGTRVKTIESCEIEYEYELHDPKVAFRQFLNVSAFPFECNNIWWPN
ncbi:hypothetical protein KI387_017612 [Taxus chinensis]|uniref:F-box domain-containing protein n=1 Tax=Taxus chinensis TaxID=29808 RepID=A0AA38GJC0_TAXCH|nr:hypothetical protein KI387_017612 [Taxus chinensis]